MGVGRHSAGSRQAWKGLGGTTDRIGRFFGTAERFGPSRCAMFDLLVGGTVCKSLGVQLPPGLRAARFFSCPVSVREWVDGVRLSETEERVDGLGLVPVAQ